MHHVRMYGAPCLLSPLHPAGRFYSSYYHLAIELGLSLR